MILSKKKPKINLSQKEIEQIILHLISKETYSLFLYGSQLTQRANEASDVDLLLVLKNLKGHQMKKLKKSKEDLERVLNKKVSLNIHVLEELNPAYAKRDIFIHKNRSELFIYKYKYHYKLLYGKNPFLNFKDPSSIKIRKETIKLLYSFSYFLRKFIYNSELAPHKEKEFVRTPLICLEYIAAFFGYIAFDKHDAFSYLKRKHLLDRVSLRLIENLFAAKDSLDYLKKRGIGEIEIIQFIENITKKLVGVYLQRGISDIRLVRGEVKETWDLSYPQAVCMGILRKGNSILLFQRTKDDYLYPGKWTTIGGYFKKGESEEQCIIRETLEETGLCDINIRSLFGKKPIIGTRVASYCYEISARGQVNLKEHKNMKWVELNDCLKLDLTPETRVFLRNYLNRRN